MCYAKLLGHEWWWWQVERRVFEQKCFFNQTKNICFNGPYKHIRTHSHSHIRVWCLFYMMCTKYIHIYAQTIVCKVTRIAIMVNCWVRILCPFGVSLICLFLVFVFVVFRRQNRVFKSHKWQWNKQKSMRLCGIFAVILWLPLSLSWYCVIAVLFTFA